MRCKLRAVSTSVRASLFIVLFSLGAYGQRCQQLTFPVDASAPYQFSTAEQSPRPLGLADLSGGQLIRSTTSQWPLYGTSSANSESPLGPCTGCMNPITITFSQPVSDPTVHLVNLEPYLADSGSMLPKFSITDDHGHRSEAWIDTYYSPSVYLGITAQNVTSLSVAFDNRVKRCFWAWDDASWSWVWRCVEDAFDRYAFGVDQIEYCYTPVVSTFSLRAGLDLGQPATEETVEVGSTLPTAHVPLGSTFHLQLLKKDEQGNLVPVATSVQVSSQTTDGLVSTVTFFPQTVLLSYSQPAAEEKRVFSAVHQGTASLVLTPSSVNAPAVNVQVSVDLPCRLGSTYHVLNPPNDVPWPDTEFPLDQMVAWYANYRGIPPHILKGQIQQESAFHLNAYRYEPVSIDRKWISGGQNLLFDSLYSHEGTKAVDYGLPLRDVAPPPGLGSYLTVPEDLRPRSDYQTGNMPGEVRPLFILQDRKLAEERLSGDGSILQPGDLTRIIDSSPGSWDKLVTAREIFDVNNGYWRWVKVKDETEVSALRPKLLFSAQTTLAASYGLMQLLYPVAIERDFSKESGKAPHPYLLFDTLNNLSGTASIHLGTKHLVLKECRSSPTLCVAVSPGLYPTPSDWDAVLKDALFRYNGGRPYANEVTEKASKFPLVARSLIFSRTDDTSCEVK